MHVEPSNRRAAPAPGQRARPDDAGVARDATPSPSRPAESPALDRREVARLCRPPVGTGIARQGRAAGESRKDTMTMPIRLFLHITLALSATAAAGCGLFDDEDAWWEGTDEPSYGDKADGIAPLTIFLSREQANIRRIIDDERLGSLPRSLTGVLNLDGVTLSDDVVLIIEGAVHRFDHQVDQHLLVVQPHFVSAADGAANPGGFLLVDLKDEERRHVISEEGAPFGAAPGRFIGRVIATTEVGLADELSSQLRDYYIRPVHFGERPPNVLDLGDENPTTLYVRPNVALTLLAPADGCLGDAVVDTTVDGKPLRVAATVDGFPAGPVDVEIRYRRPHYAHDSVGEQLWDYISGLVDAGVEERREKRVAFVATGKTTAEVAFDDYRTGSPPAGEDLFPTEIELVAATSASNSAYAQSAVHQVTVVDEGAQVIVDHFDLCPPGDEGCRRLRDQDAALNLVARRNIVEWQAERDGLYRTVTEPLSRCAGGDAIPGDFSEDCVAYHESDDTELSAHLATQLQFELTVNGEAQGGASWGGAIQGLASADIAAAFKATFQLDADLSAKFSSSRVWRDHHSLDVIYDPSTTQIQWWRVVTPRLRYIELADFDACGQELSSHEIFLSDLRDSRIVIACEEVPSFDSVCHAVEPTVESNAACDELLIDPASELGMECLGQ